MCRCLFFILLTLTIQTNAQGQHADSVSLATAINTSQLQFQKSLDISAPIFNGTAYIHYWNKVLGHPFFETEQPQISSICYKNYTYFNMPLKYDIVKSQLVIINPSNGFEMALISEHISDFHIAAHQFLTIPNDSTRSDMPGPGFYELLYSGKTTVIAKYRKRIEASLKAEDNYSKFVEYASYYVRVNGAYHLVESSADLFKLLNDSKAQLKKYSNKEKLHFSKSPLKTLVSIAAYYDLTRHE